MTSEAHGPGPGGDGFVLDRFQLEAIDAIDADRSVLVSAPTGSGKTVIAEHAVARALATGEKAFYTAPIKALSNQKFHDLVQRHGRARVGLLTGDNVVNGGAPIVVMTTEVLRNMLYAGSPALEGLGWVVLDEVHYLQDPYRGAVWEEVVVHTPPEVRLVCLSATVSNVDELAGWISSVRGPTTTVVETHRPVELRHQELIADRSMDRLRLLDVLIDNRPNPEGSDFDAVPIGRSPDRRGRPRPRYSTPRRLEVVERLAAEQLLPAIYFIFSRAGCSEAMHRVADAGVRLTSTEERRRIRRILTRHVGGLSREDLDVLSYRRFATAVEAGIAAHHAGLVPPFKEAVEECFAAGLVKVVFATETLALGVNMPARSVVLESLTKFGGEQHDVLTPAEYTQLTGRAGRRGLDPVGHALVLWSRDVTFDQVAALAASRQFTLTSAFQPTYNMAVNLVRRHSPTEARDLLEQSFAQYQSDADLHRLARRRRERIDEAGRLRRALRCTHGDVEEYAALVARARTARRATSSVRELDAALSRLKPGDVVRAPTAHGRAVVLSATHRRGAARVQVVDPEARLVTFHAADLRNPLTLIDHLELPQPFRPGDASYRHEVAQLVRRARGSKGRKAARGAADRGARGTGVGEAGVPEAQEAAQHPVAACPDARRHLRDVAQLRGVEAEIAAVDRRIDQRGSGLADRFDRILQLLEAWGHLVDWSLSPKGEVLAGIYHECDLLVAEAATTGIFDGLGPAEVAGLVSCLTYEHRSRTPPPAPWFPDRDLRTRFESLESLADELRADEARLGLPLTRPPDPTFFPLAQAWAAGTGLGTVLADEELSGGDFVRNARQLADLLRQLAQRAPVAATRISATAAAEALLRGVVAASGVEPERGDPVHAPAPDGDPA